MGNEGNCKSHVIELLEYTYGDLSCIVTVGG